jgi:hypothetical protein
VRYDLTGPGCCGPRRAGAVLCVNPADAAATTGPHRLLPAFARNGADRPHGAGAPGVDRAAPAPGRNEGFTLAAHPAIPYGLALIDAPDVNSVAQGNRETGRRLLGAADSWLLVTTAERYADAVPWELLQEAWRRRLSVAVVLNRVPAESAGEVNQAFAEMLATYLPQAGTEIPVFTVPETTLTAGLIPEYLLDQLATWLRAVSQDPAARLAAVHRTILGLLDDLPQQISVLYEALTTQGEVANRLRVQADLAYSGERAALHDAVAAGELIGGAALVEWQSLIGPGRVETLLDPASGAGSTARRLLLAAIADQVSAAIARASEQVAHAWRGTIPAEEENRLAVPAGTRPARSPRSSRSGRTGWRADRAYPAAAGRRAERARLPDRGAHRDGAVRTRTAPAAAAAQGGAAHPGRRRHPPAGRPGVPRRARRTAGRAGRGLAGRGARRALRPARLPAPAGAGRARHRPGRGQALLEAGYVVQRARR